MTVEYRKRFRNAISKVADFIESKNTAGSGLRWTQKIIDKLEHIAGLKIEHPICRNQSLARYEYRCFHIGEWVVAYRKDRDKFIVYRFIHGSRLK